MTRKHFTAAAAQVRTLRGNAGALAAKIVADEFADFFAQFNPDFDRGRFYAACGL